jgi:hypothetical protein
MLSQADLLIFDGEAAGVISQTVTVPPSPDLVVTFWAKMAGPFTCTTSFGGEDISSCDVTLTDDWTEYTCGALNTNPSISNTAFVFSLKTICMPTANANAASVAVVNFDNISMDACFS